MRELEEDSRLEDAGEGRFRGTISDRWSIGTVPNGGYVLAFGIGAVQRVTPFRDPVVATAYYVRPTEAGEAVVHTEVIKVGKRFATVQARIVQGGEERTRVVATMGTVPDADAVTHLAITPPALPPREECVSDRPAGATPEIGKRFDMALTKDSVAFMRGERTGRAVLEGYVDFTDHAVPDLRALTLLADAFPPPVFNVVSPGWVPTLELTVQIRARPRASTVVGRFTTRSVINGLLEEDGELWDLDGRLLAISRQTAILPR